MARTLLLLVATCAARHGATSATEMDVAIRAEVHGRDGASFRRLLQCGDDGLPLPGFPAVAAGVPCRCLPFPAVAAGEDGLRGSKHVCDDADRWRGLPVTRTNVAYALEQESRCWLVGRAVRVGVAGKDGAAGRSSAHSEYATGLTRSKVVVTANPTHWEGDARLAEAMRSGALVLVDRMVNPHAAVVNGSTVLVYRSVREMLEYVAVLTQPGALALRAKVDLVAARGRRMAKAHPTPLRR